VADEQGDKPTFGDLARRLGQLPGDKKRAALETSAALAGVSLRVSREFVEAVPPAAKILSAADLRLWGELGRRLAMGSAASGADFFAHGVDGLKHIPRRSRADLFQICTRQLVLSSSIALATFTRIPEIAAEIDDDQLLSDTLALASQIAQRSAKHSAEFIEHTPDVARSLALFGSDKRLVADAALSLASQFAGRTGGMTADLWGQLPEAFGRITASNAVRLAARAEEFLEFGGSVTLHFISAGSEVLANSDAVFEDWAAMARAIAGYGNAVLISFLRSTPKVFAAFQKGSSRPAELRDVIRLVSKIAETDAESALAAFKSSAFALRKVPLKQFADWVETGLSATAAESAKARRSYFALETRASNARLQQTRIGLPLERIQTVLRLYVEALTGKEVEIAAISAVPHESRIGDGKTIYLPASVAEFDDDEMDFRLFKVLAAHGAGQIEFGTFDLDTSELRAAYAELSELYSATPDELDTFSLGGYIEDVQKAEKASSEDQAQDARRRKLPAGSDYRTVLTAFPEPRLARKIFGTMENARIDARLRSTYRGLVKDLDLMQSFLRANRPYIFDLPMHQVPFELLFQITLCGGATEDARQFHGQVVSEIEGVLEKFFHHRDTETQSAKGSLIVEEESSIFSVSPGLRGSNLPTVADSLMATSRVYTLFQNISPEETQEAESDNTEENTDFAYDDKNAAEAVTEDQVKREQPQNAQDIRDLFSAWNSDDDEGVGWSRVIEKKVKKGDRNFVELARTRYRGVISSIRHQFQLMKPENLTRINRELDGEDYDLNALVDFVIDRRADGRQSENIYTKRLRKQRDVAVSLLLDQSSSTARTITRNPLQPYTHPGRRIIEIEKEGLVLMSEALEAVGDVYSINGFTSEGRRNVKFYVVKDFAEKYSDEIERRIGGITFQNNTRLGAAIRHAAAKLLRQESRTKLLIILTDGRPYDHDYGDARYAREDVREALIEAKSRGITPFCITIDRESESELKDLYGDVGYTIIDDVLTLPERMPNIYRRLTS
jgi:nitric oxide reductase NorD protein